MKHSVFFQKHPVFTRSELAEHLSSQGKVGPRGQEALLSYHQRTGRIVQVRRGLYAVIPVGANSEMYPVDRLLVASRLTTDAVLSHHTALEFHGRAYSVWEETTYSASRPLGLFSFRGHVYRGTMYPRALLKSGKKNYSVVTGERAGMDLRVTSLERTMVDVLHRPDLSGSWEEIWRSLESIEFFDLDVILEYVEILGNATTVAKVGFFLEQHRDNLMVQEHLLMALRDMRPRQPHYLDRSNRSSGSLVADWNLVIPELVINRSWDEVS